MREALTVVGFLLIVAFAALFAAPLYVDWNTWRDTIASRFSDHLGTVVTIDGRIEAHLLPQPWLSVRDVKIGNPNGSTRLTIGALQGDLSLSALLSGTIELSNLVLTAPRLDVHSAADGTIESLSGKGVSGDAAIENFEIQDGSLDYVDGRTGRQLVLDGIQLLGEARSLAGPVKGEGGVQINGVKHTLKLSTGAAGPGGLKFKASIVPADKQVTLDVDGVIALQAGGPGFEGTAVLARPILDARGDKAPPEEPWSISGRIRLTPSDLVAETVAVQLGPDERAVKLTGGASVIFGQEPRLDAMLTSTQLELDRLAGVAPDERVAPLAVLMRLKDSLPAGGLSMPARIGVTAQGVMLGGQLLQQVEAELVSSGTGVQLKRLEAQLPGQGHVVVTGGTERPDADDASVRGTLALQARQASSLLAWLQGDSRPASPRAARRLDLSADFAASANSVALSALKLAIDDASVEGRVAWLRLQLDQPAGRIEANLTAQRLDLDALPAAAALLPGGSAALSEADIRLSAQSIVFAGIEAKSANGRVRVGGKLIALEDVTIDDLGGTSLTANGRIDTVGAAPQGEIRVTLDGRDLTGFAKALRRSSLPAAFLDALGRRAAALSPASADIVASFGQTRRLTLAGKLGGTVTQFALDLSGPDDSPVIDMHLKADSLDAPMLVRQIGWTPAAASMAGRNSLDMTLAGPLDGVRRWSMGFSGAGVEASGTGKMTGPFESPAFDGRLTAKAADVLTPALLFGISLPGALPGDSAQIETGLRLRGGRLVFDDLTGAAFGMPMAGTLTLDPGSPTRVEGSLNFQSADAVQLGSLLAGSDLTGAPEQGSEWPAGPFGATTFAGLSGTVNLTARALTLSPNLPVATAAKARLSFEPNSVSLEGLTAAMADGTLSASLRLSKSALETALTGTVALDRLMIESSIATGRLTASIDLQGTGRTPAALASSLTGGGTLAFLQPRFNGLSEAAFGAAVAAIDAGTAPRIDKVQSLFDSSLAEAPLATADVSGSLALAGGVLRLATTTTKASFTGVTLSGSVDLSSLTARADVYLAPPPPADGLGGRPPSVEVSVAGPLDALERHVDVSSMTAWLTVRAAEREAKTLEALEAERAAREKLIEEQRRIEGERIQRAIEAQKAAEEAARILQEPAPPQGASPAPPAPGDAPVETGPAVDAPSPASQSPAPGNAPVAPPAVLFEPSITVPPPLIRPTNGIAVPPRAPPRRPAFLGPPPRSSSLLEPRLQVAPATLEVTRPRPPKSIPGLESRPPAAGSQIDIPVIEPNFPPPP